MSESSEQQALMQWAALASTTIPELRMLLASANGGLRSKATAARLKREGVKAGYPDLALDVSRHGYHGLRIELKYGKGRVSESQKWWHERLTEQRYLVFVCIGWEAAKDVLVAYLSDGVIIGQSADIRH